MGQDWLALIRLALIKDDMTVRRDDVNNENWADINQALAATRTQKGDKRGGFSLVNPALLQGAA